MAARCRAQTYKKRCTKKEKWYKGINKWLPCLLVEHWSKREKERGSGRDMPSVSIMSNRSNSMAEVLR